MMNERQRREQRQRLKRLGIRAIQSVVNFIAVAVLGACLPQRQDL